MTRNYIVRPSSTGKTKELLVTAKDLGATVVCKNPEAMLVKSNNYGIYGLRFCSYSNIDDLAAGSKVVVDDLDDFFSFKFAKELSGFSVTKD